MEQPVYERIKFLRRQELGLVRKDFADPVGITEGVLYLIEKGKYKNVSLDLLTRICEVYKCEWNWLVKGEGKPFLNKDGDSGEVLHLYSKGYENQQKPATESGPQSFEWFEKELEKKEKEIEEWKRRYDKLSDALLSIKTQGGELEGLGSASQVPVRRIDIN